MDSISNKCCVAKNRVHKNVQREASCYTLFSVGKSSYSVCISLRDNTMKVVGTRLTRQLQVMWKSGLWTMTA